MNYTEQERMASWHDRAFQAGYDARYEGKTTVQRPVIFQGILYRSWRAGWHKADKELKT